MLCLLELSTPGLTNHPDLQEIDEFSASGFTIFELSERVAGSPRTLIFGTAIWHLTRLSSRSAKRLSYCENKGRRRMLHSPEEMDLRYFFGFGACFAAVAVFFFWLALLAFPCFCFDCF